jgi:biotin transport system substrate-specific component
MTFSTASPRSLALARAETSVRSAVAVLAFAGALAAAGRFRIPLPFTPVPVTLQTFVLFLGAALLGPTRGASGPALLFIAGSAGLPVFGGGGAGLAHAFGPTGGYLLAWIPAAAAIGLLANARPLALAGVMALVSAGILLAGSIWFAFVSGIPIGESLRFNALPFVPGDAIKIGAAVLGVSALRAPVSRWLHRGRD